MPKIRFPELGLVGQHTSDIQKKQGTGQVKQEVGVDKEEVKNRNGIGINENMKVQSI